MILRPGARRRGGSRRNAACRSSLVADVGSRFARERACCISAKFAITLIESHWLPLSVRLCKEANSPSLTGTDERQAPDGSVTNRYNYRVVRLWNVLKGVANVQQSATHQAILRQGRQEGVIEGRAEGRVAREQRMLLRQRTKRLGEPDAATVAPIEAIEDVDRLESLGERILGTGRRRV
jgi:hypothetical protein